MKVLLLKNIPKVGQQGDVVEVKDGFGRNYLLNKGLGRPADETVIKQIAERKAALVQRLAAREEGLQQYVERIAGVELKLKAKANPQGVLFASIKNKEVLEKLHGEGYTILEEKDLEGFPLKHIGEHTISVKFGKRLIPIKVIIEP